MGVVPLVGTWIEIQGYFSPFSAFSVVPLVGTWIEIDTDSICVELRGRAPRGHVD